MRIAITGATGNVGTALLRRLTDEPDIELIGIARRPPPPDAGHPYDRVRWHALDLGEPDNVPRLTEVLRGVDAVVHLAWQIQPSHRRALLRRTNLTGTRHLLHAIDEAGVTTMAYASSIGAYARGPKDRRVSESWPATGVGGSGYSTDKAAVEALLDGVEHDHPELRLIRMRQALVFQRDAGAQIRRYFIGRVLPVSWLRSGRLPVVPRNKRLRAQVVHAEDLAEAYRLALRGDASGAFNIAAEPVLDGPVLAENLGGRAIPMPIFLLRMLAKAAWRLRLLPTEPGWIDLTAGVPLVDSSRAQQELGWRPRHDAREAVRDLFGGIAVGAGTGSTALRPEPRARAQGLNRRPSPG
ncbi:nucleoside-diphosphate-sugar epimerase [Micromonospora pisi]|uniref:Nucleoside-diphosphate-sugar epimerase n=1 Tax=Micromonospora pisi TaxID=589240 RepID=A0A495JJZ5_9ACTN|nr:NAD-dependent epimerase/dehydratase family protein [Micromonospora pisi]RKR89005.1 nucleoside-diphosphate-sugar epimerase [Micromonospora pisi]